MRRAGPSESPLWRVGPSERAKIADEGRGRAGPSATIAPRRHQSQDSMEGVTGDLGGRVHLLHTCNIPKETAYQLLFSFLETHHSNDE
jgi:hypothetical protein